MPSILVGVSVGPGGQWARSYQVVPLSSILLEGRASRVSIRTVVDIILFEVVSFLLKQRLTRHGALEDATLPAPCASDTNEKLEVVAEEGTDDLLEYDGLLNENAARFKKTKTVEVMMALDPDTGSNDDAQVEMDGAQLEADGQLPQFGGGTNTGFQLIETDVEDAALI